MSAFPYTIFPLILRIAGAFRDKINILRTRDILRGGMAGAKIEDELKKCREHLEELVRERTADLQRINEELRKEIAARQGAEERARHLASFPQLNPNPVIEVASSGNISFCNPATGKILENLGMAKEDINAFLPADMDGILSSWNRKHEASHYRLVSVRDRTFAESIYLYPQFDGARIYARDITERKLAEEALRESEEKYRRLFENMGEGFALYELLYEDGKPVDWRVLELNDAYSLHTAIPRDRIVGRRMSDFSLEAVSEYLPRFAEVVAKQKSMAFETHTKLTGRHLHVMSFPAGPNRIANVITDITERKGAEEALQKSEERFRLIAETSSDLIFQIDLSGRIAYTSPAVQQFGYLPEEVVGKHFPDYVAPEYVPMATEAFRQSISGHRIDLFELSLVKKDGSPSMVEVSAAPIFHGGQIAGVQGIARDISERKRAEAALGESEERQRLAIAAASLGTWDYNPLTGALNWDSRCKELFGLPPEVSIDYETFLAGLHPEDRERTRRVVQAAFDPAGGGNFDIEYRTVGLKDGGVLRWIRATGRTFFNEEGRAIRFIGTVRDITKGKNAEAEIKKHLEELQAANAELARFNTAAVGRELRMIEMKKEINELREKAGTGPLYPLDFEKEG